MVVYYSVVIGNEDATSEDKSIYEMFLEHHTPVCPEKLNYLISCINFIGDRKGALQQYFRLENDASALPPPTNVAKKELVSIINEDIEVSGFDLRLYCLRLNDNVVILFNGGIKTTDYPQDCPNVRRHFNMANTLAKKITEAITDNEIEVSEDDILYDNDFEIIF